MVERGVRTGPGWRLVAGEAHVSPWRAHAIGKLVLDEAPRIPHPDCLPEAHRGTFAGIASVSMEYPAGLMRAR